MFDNKRYISRGIHDGVPLSLQVIMWQMVDDLKAKKKKIDYLQVFELEFDEKRLSIQHSSESPKYSRTYEFHVGSVGTESKQRGRIIWVMDDGQYSLMMFPQER